jgi:biotin-dependent carboxylase-like uncharacterized protein
MSARLAVVARAGALTTIQDLGRLGHAHLAVPRAGAADLPAHLLANRLVGNLAEAATLETTLTGVALRFMCQAWVAVTGAVAPVTIDGRPASWGLPVLARCGQTLEVGQATHGLRSYVAVSGGFDATPVLGSRSRDLLAGIGPDPLTDGQQLTLGPPGRPPAHLDLAPWPVPCEDPVLAVTPGPRDDWFPPAAMDLLLSERWTVTPDSNRIGIRLAGRDLPRARRGELPSEGTITGAIEVPSNGQPLIVLNDHPATIGYPVIAIVSPASLAACAQLRPGQPVHFTRRAPSAQAGGYQIRRRGSPRQGPDQAGQPHGHRDR